MIRSLLSLAAASWSAYNALNFLPVGAYLNEGASGGVDGDPGAVAVTWAARNLFVGLTILSLAIIDWDWLGRVLSSSTDPPPRDPRDI